MRHRFLRTAAGAMASFLVLGGVGACSGQAARADGEAAVVRQAYLEYWQALISANSGPDPGSSLLAQHAASSQLALLQRNLGLDVRTGVYAAGTVSHDIRSVTVQGSVAYVVDCVDLDHWLLYRQHTRVLISQLRDRPRQLATFTLAEDGRDWKVTNSEGYGNC